jgi:PPOX class probable F420-dependent enzyme
MVLDQDTEFGARVARRLRAEPVAWLTTVDAAGRPQPAPVWFLWGESEDTVLVYSDQRAKRLEHLAANPRVALHLDGNGRGGDIVVLTGHLAVSDDPSAAKHADYLAKYGKLIGRGWSSPEEFAETYSVPLRLTRISVRGH